MKRSSYGERDYAFGQIMLTLRTRIGLTQAGLADYLGVSGRAVGEWEAGSSYPKAEHLKQFIALAVKQQSFPAGREAEEVRALWKAAHQKVLLDEQWLSELLDQRRPPLPVEETSGTEHVIARPPGGPRVDWNDALAVPTFYGRKPELAALSQWVLQERCRVVSVLGMGGIGKSALVTSAMHQLAAHFQVVIFRSLRDAPSCGALLDECLQVLAPQPLGLVPADLDRRLSLLLENLREQRVLLVLDNVEALLEEGDVRGHLLPGQQAYVRLLRQLAQTAHQSCLLLTSREKPAVLRALEGTRSPVRSLRLTGLDIAACEQLLADNELVGSQEEQARLVERYAGNPLALKIVAETIADLFGGAIGPFLTQGTVVFGSIADLLDEQFARLSPLEQTVLCWLAIVREPVTLDELRAVLVARFSPEQVLEAVDGLRRRSLVERGLRLGSVTLQSVVLEYVTAVLITEASGEIQQGRLERLIQHGLEQAHAKEYVRQTQERLLVAPLLARLQSVYQGRAEVEEQLCSLLDRLRERADDAQGYGPANLIALLRLQRGHLRGIDLSKLSIRGANMQGLELQDASLVGALIRDSVFTESLDAVWAVAISSNGMLWAAGSWRGEVRVWDEGGQTLRLVWQAHTDIVLTLTFSPDGHTLASGGLDGTVKLWDLDSGTLLWTGWQNSIQSLAFAPDGSLLASGGLDATVRLWDCQSGANLQTLPHPGHVFAVTWSPDGRLLASGDFDGSIRVWEMQKTPPATSVEVLSGHSGWVTSLAFAPDGRTLVSASWDQTVKLWEVSSGCLRQTLSGHTDHAFRVAWSPDGRTVASCGFDETIWLWDVEQGRYRAALHGHTAHMYGIAFTPDSSSLLSGSEDGTLRVWDVASGQCVRVIRGYAVSYYDIDWSPDGTQLVSGDTDALVTIWDLTGGTQPRVLRGHHWVVGGVGWSPDGRWLASSEWDDTIRLWDAASGACAQTFQDPAAVLLGMAWSPDGHLLACGSYLQGVHVWDVAARSCRWVGRTHLTAFRRVAWSPDGTRVVGGGDDGSVCLWDAADGTLLQQLSEHHGMVASVAWSPDGMRLASAGGGQGQGDSGELFVWDVQRGERVRIFAGLRGIVYAVTWGPSGDVLVSGGSDGALRWWDVQRGECVRIREAHQGAVRSLRISPDGRRLASCGDDGAIMFWDLNSCEHLRTLRLDRPYGRLNIAGIRGLTEAQKATLRALGAIEEITVPLSETLY